MSWRVAAALGATGKNGLLGEVNARAPTRSKVSDGGIGDARHSASVSDHVHVSVQHDAALYDDDAPWDWEAAVPPPTL